jgi:hypothetical protein
MVSDPVDVAPKEPCVEAAAGAAVSNAPAMPARSDERNWLIIVRFPLGSIRIGGIIKGLNRIML